MLHIRIVRTVIAAAALAVSVFGFAPARADSPFASWAAVVVAGDWRAHGGGATEAFDNARRDVSKELEALGFTQGHTRQFSARAERFTNEGVLPSDARTIRAALKDLARDANGGCLVYFTSHGSRDGIVVGNKMMTPRDLSRILDDACGDRLTVAILSACFSGVFVDRLESSTRMILTAARPDRSSFGCGEADKYPYFDACFLASLDGSHNFPALGRAVQNCVAERERVTRSWPPSEPQLSLGRTIAPMLETYAFAREEAGSLVNPLCTGKDSNVMLPPGC